MAAGSFSKVWGSFGGPTSADDRFGPGAHVTFDFQHPVEIIFFGGLFWFQGNLSLR